MMIIRIGSTLMRSTLRSIKFYRPTAHPFSKNVLQQLCFQHHIIDASLLWWDVWAVPIQIFAWIYHGSLLSECCQLIACLLGWIVHFTVPKLPKHHLLPPPILLSIITFYLWSEDGVFKFLQKRKQKFWLNLH